MRVKEIEPLTPQQRAESLGLDAAAFPRTRMTQEAEAAVNFIKRKDRSDYKVKL
jgi:hypothetical protein